METTYSRPTHSPSAACSNGDGTTKTRVLTPHGYVTVGGPYAAVDLKTSASRDRVYGRLPTDTRALEGLDGCYVRDAIVHAATCDPGLAKCQFAKPALYESVKRKCSRDKAECLQVLEGIDRCEMWSDNDAVLAAFSRTRLIANVYHDECSGPTVVVEVPDAVIAGREIRVHARNYLRALVDEFWRNKTPLRVRQQLEAA